MKRSMGKTERGKGIVNNEAQIIVDSDAFVGLMWEKDELHARVTKLFTHLQKKHIQLTTTSAVVAETATVLSHRKDQALARKFLDVLIESSSIPVIWIDELVYNEALTLFKKQTKKGTSYTDCVNAVVCRKLELTHIFSFDRAYPSCFGIKLISQTD